MKKQRKIKTVVIEEPEITAMPVAPETTETTITAEEIADLLSEARETERRENLKECEQRVNSARQQEWENGQRECELRVQQAVRQERDRIHEILHRMEAEAEGMGFSAIANWLRIAIEKAVSQ